MREVSFGDKKVLLSQVRGTIYAVGAECPHYGVSLAKGLLCGDRVVCPWHKSCFRVTDGALLDPPARDSLPRYRVSVENDDVYLQLGESEPALRMISEHADSRCFAIVGAGAAGTAAAESLRERGFTGRLVLVSAEPELPYDRTKLSKEFLSGNAGVEQLPLRPREFYQDNKIELIPKTVSRADARERKLEFEDGSVLSCDSLLIASGGEARTLTIPGSDLGNVFVLRTQQQAEAILRNSPPGVRVVVLGGSFIALEAASCFGLRHIPTTVVLSEQEPFQKTFGKEVGGAIRRFHEAHGIDFRRNAKVRRLKGTGVVQHVVLESGEEIPADVVLIGAGVEPRTAFVHGVTKNEDGGVVVDGFLQAAPGVYAAGDVAAFPLRQQEQLARIEHWRVAEQHGRSAAGNMLGTREAFAGVPYFWTNHFGTRFDYLGHAETWEETILQGDLAKPEFLVFYVAQGVIVAAAACGHDLEIAALHELMHLGNVPSPAEVRSGVDLVRLAKSACV